MALFRTSQHLHTIQGRPNNCNCAGGCVHRVTIRFRLRIISRGRVMNPIGMAMILRSCSKWKVPHTYRDGTNYMQQVIIPALASYFKATKEKTLLALKDGENADDVLAHLDDDRAYIMCFFGVDDEVVGVDTLSSLLLVYLGFPFDTYDVSHVLQWFRTEPEARQKRNLYMLLLGYVKIEETSKNGMGEVEVASAVSSSFGAGTEMVSFSGVLAVETSNTFFLAMLHFPHVMRKAQAKLDNVVGPDNTPKKAFRTALTQEDKYQGMYATFEPMHE
ncbi:hypothetical protein BDR06DRAFT_1004669 [Suillus hirtellus]|nr:hypothetical protein BDR06DRAFT_1004669 [Suillus hirtellus]